MKQRKMRMIIICIIVAICILGIAGYLLTKKDTSSITFIENDVIEYGDQNSSSKSLVEDTNATITSYPKINVMKIGKQTLTYVVKDGSSTKEITHEITIKDTKKPSVEFKEEEVSCLFDSEFNPVLNIQSIKDPVDGELQYHESSKKGSYQVTSNVNTSKEGSYTVEVTAIDKNGNKAKKSYKVTVKKGTQGTSQEIQPTYINGILIVNKKYGLPSSFGEMDSSAYAALQNLQKEAQEAGYDIPTLSGFRTYDTQVTLYNNYVARDGKEAADRYSARPGFSEHQSGLCFDIGAIDDNYGETPAGKWLEENCHKYGFIIRYPNGKENITGYMYEPWHVRYVGETVATTIMNKGITLEEYLGVNG
ncbi:MAG: D-alanyl-D-alanine carboxypeptidase family protein [Longicatena sp.]